MLENRLSVLPALCIVLSAAEAFLVAMLSIYGPLSAPIRRFERHHNWWPFGGLDMMPRAFYNEMARMGEMEREVMARLRDEGCSVVDDKDKFGVQLDMRAFKPEEVEVRVHDEDGKDAYLAISGKHEERNDEHGFVSRQFSRRILLPKDVDAKALQCTWSPDGVLSMMAPRKALPAPDGKSGRVIPITRGEKPAIEKKK